MEKSSSFVTLKGKPVALLGERVKPGDRAKDFSLTDAGFMTRSLDDYHGKIKVIAVYLSVDTGICAAQNRKFNEMASSLSDDVVVLSVSCDLPYAQSRFCAAEGLKNVITLSDYKDADFGVQYGFLISELRLLARGTVIIDKENVIRYVEYVPEIATEPDYDAALEAVRKIV
jgi:thiol peroxidase